MEEKFPRSEKVLGVLSQIKKLADKKGIRFWLLGGLANAFHAGFIYREHEDLDLIVKNIEDQNKFLEILEDLGFVKDREKKMSNKLTNFIYKNKEGVEVDIGPHVREFGVRDSDFEEDEKELKGVKSFVMSKRYLISFKKYLMTKRNDLKDKMDLDYLENGL